MLQELRSSGILDLFFICAKSEVHQVSQPAVSCLVLIWQWYLRRTPTASFSINQISCCFPEGPTPIAEDAAATAVGPEHEGSTTAVANGGGRRPDPTQLWSVMPVVDYAVDRASDAGDSSHAIERKARATASQWQSGRASSLNLRSSTDSYSKSGPPMTSSTGPRSTTDSCPTPRVLPVRSTTHARPKYGEPPLRAPPPPIPPAAVRISCGSLPAFCKTREAVLATPRPSSSASEHPAKEGDLQAPLACLSPLLAVTNPRANSAAAPATAPVGGGQFVSQPHDPLSAASSSSAEETLATEQNLALSKLDNTTADESGKLPKQLTGSTSLTASWDQQACRHSLSSPDSHHIPTSMLSPCQSKSYRDIDGAAITPDQLAGHFSRMRIDEHIPQSSSSLHAAANQVPRAKQAGTLDHILPQGVSSQQIRGCQAMPSHAATQSLKQHRQADCSQHSQSCLAEGHWQCMPLSHPLPSIQARAEGHKGQCFSGLERQSPAESPPTPEHRKPARYRDTDTLLVWCIQS